MTNITYVVDGMLGKLFISLVHLYPSYPRTKLCWELSKYYFCFYLVLLNFSLSLCVSPSHTLSLTITRTLSISNTRTHTLTLPTFIRKVHNEIILDVTEVVRNEFKLSRFLTNQKDFFSDTFIRIQILPKKISKKVSDPTDSDVTVSRYEVQK